MDHIMTRKEIKEYRKKIKQNIDKDMENVDHAEPLKNIVQCDKVNSNHILSRKELNKAWLQ